MVTKKINQNQELIKGLFLSLISIMILTGVYYLNIPEKEETVNPYLKSDICYYALNGIKADYHYHLQLNITIDDERIEIPMNVGFEKDDKGNTIFLHPIHTYDNSGRIHVETTKNTTAELGFFFDIWEKEFSKDNILGYTSDQNHVIEMYVNGNEVNTFENTLLEPYISIEINYLTIS